MSSDSICGEQPFVIFFSISINVNFVVFQLKGDLFFFSSLLPGINLNTQAEFCSLQSVLVFRFFFLLKLQTNFISRDHL